MRFSKIYALLLCLLISNTQMGWSSEDFYFTKTSQKNNAIFWQNFWNYLTGQPTPKEANLNIRVVNSETGLPLRGASVLVGQKNGSPFAANTAETDGDGMAYFTDPALQDGKAYTVTASLQGYGNSSVINNTENSVEIGLIPRTNEKNIGFLQGKLLGFPPGFGSTEAEVGFFIPALRPESLLNFDIQQIISAYKVEIDVFGSRKVPGNLVMPEQSKRYGIIPINISKPEFIMPLPKGLKTHMSGLTSSISISDAYDAVQEKDFLALLNLAEINHVGFTKRMTVKGDERFNFSANYELEQRIMKAQFTGIPEKLDAVAISFIDPENDQGDFVPMDVKSLKSEEISGGAGHIRLATFKQRKSTDKFYIFTGLFDRTQLTPGEGEEPITSRSVVGSLLPVDNTSMKAKFQKFLRPIQAISVGSNNREYRFTNPGTSALSPDLILVNIVSEMRNSETQGKTRTVLWSSVVKGSTDRISLPDLGKAVLPNPDNSKGETFSWEIIAIKSASKARKNIGIDIQMSLRNLQHVSSLSKKF